MPAKLRPRRAGALGAVVATAVLLTACGSSSDDATAEPTGDSTDPASDGTTAEPAADESTVTVEDNHGEIEVPVNPERVVALDNRTFQTLSDWGVAPDAVPKPLMGDLWPDLSDDPNVLDAGAHFEPNLEAAIEAEPDLIIGGYRFSDLYEDLKEIQPKTIEIHPRDGEDQISELKRQAEILGQIFDRREDARQIADDLDQAIADAGSAYNGSDTVVGLITSGGKISYAAPGSGRGVGLLFPTLDLVPGIEQESEDDTHGDDISVEAIAQANPEWLVVLDRDAPLGVDGYVSAEELIEASEALANVPAVQQDRIIYLEPGFYLDESIQAYTRLFESLATAFEDAQ